MGSDLTQYGEDLSSSYRQMFAQTSPVRWLVTGLEQFPLGFIRAHSGALLDVPCGVGSLCWQVATTDRQVVGLDISASQINEAKQFKSARLPKGLAFICQDVRELYGDPQFKSRFDIVNASWLYDVAEDEADFGRFVTAIAWCLKPGGTHLGVDLNFGIRPSDPSEWNRFGIALMEDRRPEYRPRSGDTIGGRLAMVPPRLGITDAGCALTVKYFDQGVYIRAFAQCGLEDFRIIPPHQWNMSNSNLTPRELAKWQDYVATNPEMMGFVATKRLDA